LFLQKLIDTNPNLIYVKSGNGEITLANQAFLNFYKLTQERLSGAFESEIFEDEEFTEQSKRYNEYAILDPNVLFEYSTEYKFEKLSTPAFLRITKQSIILPSQEANSIVTVITDLSELKENERRLQYSESLYRQIARNVPNSAIYVFDKKLVYHLAEGSLVGSISLPKDQIEGRHVLDTGEDMEVLKERAIRYQHVVDGHAYQSQIDEFGRSYLVNATPIRNEEGEIIFGLVVILDVTELKKVQLELEEKNEKLGRSNDELEKFAYVASHDLQSPLKTIISFLQLLDQRHGASLGDEGKEFINYCISSSTRMRNLIADLLNYSRVNSIPRPFVDTDLNDLMFVVTKNLESNIKAKGAQIEFDNLPTVLAEPYMLTQLLQNLVDNGMKFTKPGMQIKIQVGYSQTSTHHQISVSDNGIGIKSEFKDKIFQIFQRLHTDTEYSGTGIGLAICKKVVNHHQGDIWVDSVFGEGTTFHFTIKKSL
jgi:PAS domain S-box-containing protein